MKKRFAIPVMLCAVFLFMAASDDGCGQSNATDKAQTEQQNLLLAEGNAQTGMPAIKNFREKKLLKDILELRDQDGLATVTYTFSEMTGTYKKFCDSVGYGIPYATQYTNPNKPIYPDYHDSAVIPQADPNGLFSPANAEGTWVMCKDPNGSKVRPVYLEPRVIVSPFPMESR